jgi:uncharacterized repeat protein (TIGR03803 family)
MNLNEPVLTTQIKLRRNFWPVTLFGFLGFSSVLCHLPIVRAALVPQTIREFPSSPRMPYGGLVQGRDGNLYGTAAQSGYAGPSSIFKLTTNGAFETLYSFPATNGFVRVDPLVQGSDGDFYGTAYGLLKPNDFGAFFKLTTNGVLTLLYSFLPGSTGFSPQGGLVQGTDGDLYGTASSGGAFGQGVVFKLTTTGLLTTLASFNMTNGAYPIGNSETPGSISSANARQYPGPSGLSPLAHAVTRHPPPVTPAPLSRHPNGGQRRPTAVNGGQRRSTAVNGT